MTARIRLDDLTSAQLDELYDRLEAAEELLRGAAADARSRALVEAARADELTAAVWKLPRVQIHIQPDLPHAAPCPDRGQAAGPVDPAVILGIGADQPDRWQHRKDPDHEQGDGVTVRPEEYSVTAVPDEASPDAHVWALTVRHRGGDRWAVQRGEHACLGADGTWAEGVKPYDRGDDWLDAHRFDLDTALRLARQAAPHVTVNGITVAHVLERMRARP